MRPELSIFSFLCTVILAGLAPLHLQTRNIALISLICWLLLCNIIQGTNSVVWSSNTKLRSAVWCDISTKVLLGAQVALPAACTCISAHLYSLASNRDGKLRQHRTAYELSLCVLFPLIYMALHVIVQPNRFDLAEDFGCVPSTYTSIPTVIMIWIPPITLCITTFTFSILAIWSHTRRHPLLSDLGGLSSRVITITFLRPLMMATLISVVLFCVSIFAIHARVASNHGLLPWISFSYVHANISEVHIIPPSQTLELSGIEAVWWIMPTSSLLFMCIAFIGLICCVQQDSYNGQSLGKWFRSTMLRRQGGKDTFIQSSHDLTSHFTAASPIPPHPVHLKSGWDASLGSGRSTKLHVQRPSLRCKIPPTPTTPSDTESDVSFKASTLTYLESPTGREVSALASLPSLDSTLVFPAQPTAAASAQRMFAPLEEGTGLSVSPANSILSSPWPRPPSTIPSTPTNPASPRTLISRSSEHHLRSPSEASLTTSLASSTISASGYIPDPDIFLHSVNTSPHRPPFQDAGIPAPVLNVPPHRHVRRTPSKDMLSTRSLGSSVMRAAGRKREQNAMGEAIYMTVVHETETC